MATYSFLEYINIGKVSTYLATKEKLLGSLFGKKLYPNRPVILAMETDSNNWMYEYDSTLSTLTETCQYLFSLCISKAIVIANAGSGGSVSPATPNAAYLYTVLSITVTSAGATYQNDELINGTEVDFIIYANTNLTANEGDFTFNSTTGTITFSTVTLVVGNTLTIPFNKRIN